MSSHPTEGEGDEPDPSTSDITLLYLIKQVELVVRARLDVVAGSHGITALQYTALTVLERRPGMTSAQLARNSFVRAQTMAQMVTNLEERGLIQREQDPTSRRQYRTFLTESGRALLADVRPAVAAIEREMVADLSSEDVDQLRRALRACRVNLSGLHPR